MGYLPNGFSIDDANASTQDTYDLDFSNWGLRASAGDNTNLRFPQPGSGPIATTLAGLSIGARSTVDRCWVTWDRQKFVPPTQGRLSYSPHVSLPRYLSLGTPLVYPQANSGAPGMIDSAGGLVEALQKGWLYIFAYGDTAVGADSSPHFGNAGLTTILPTTYLNQFGGSSTFSSSDGAFEAPYLHLVLNLRATGAVLAPASRRFPLNRGTTSSVDGSGTPNRLALIPIFGRKRVAVQAVSYNAGAGDGPQVCNFYVGLIRNVNELGDPQGGGRACSTVEAPAGSALAVPASQIATQFVIDNPCADYVVLYASSAVANQVAFTITAED